MGGPSSLWRVVVLGVIRKQAEKAIRNKPEIILPWVLLHLVPALSSFNDGLQCGTGSMT